MKKSILLSLIFSLSFIAAPSRAAETTTIKNCVNINTGASRYVSNATTKCRPFEKLTKITMPVKKVKTPSNGVNGKDGATVLSGVGTPKAELGKVGDIYFDTGYRMMYGPKTAEGWGNGFSIVGPSGGGGAGPKGDTGPAGPISFGDYASFHDTSTVLLTANTATAIPVNVTDFANGISSEQDINSKYTKIRFSHAGKFNVTFSSQLNKVDTGTDTLSIWLSRNGTNIPWTNTDIILTGKDLHQVASWNFFLDLSANDYIQLMISPGSSTSSQILSLPAQTAPVRPEIPGTILTVNQVG